MKSEKPDLVAKPPHYIDGRSHEPIAVIEDWKLPYHLGNVVKYISRAGRKDGAATLDDLLKARWYLSRYIDLLESGAEGAGGPDLVLATLAINPGFLPVTKETADYLFAQLSTLACEYDKGGHVNTSQYRIKEPPK